MGFLFGLLGHAPGVGLGGTMGGGTFFSEIQPDLVCELLTRLSHATAQFLVPVSWGLWEGPKGQISLNLNYKVNFKDFKTKLCVFSQKLKI